MHWADPASLDLIRALAREIHTLPVLLVATYRPEEAPTGSPLAHLLLTLVREARPARLDLLPLTPDAIEALVMARYTLVMSRPPPPRPAPTAFAYYSSASW